MPGHSLRNSFQKTILQGDNWRQSVPDQLHSTIDPMVTRKREDPFTPDPKRGLDMKKMKEYTSPVPKTPLRNVLTPERNGVKHSSVLKEAAEILGSASKLRQSLSFENMKDEMDDDKRILVKKEDAAKRRRERKHNLMSPVVGSSPKAALPQSVGAKSSLKKSTSGEMLVSTPIASVIAGDIANRPLHGSGTKPKMTAEQMNRVFEEWIKIAADNVPFPNINCISYLLL